MLPLRIIFFSKLLFPPQAIGCTPIKNPPNTYAQQEGDSLTIRCHQTDQSWTLKCIRTQWIGSFGNCSTPTGNILFLQVSKYLLQCHKVYTFVIKPQWYPLKLKSLLCIISTTGKPGVITEDDVSLEDEGDKLPSPRQSLSKGQHILESSKAFGLMKVG